MTRSALVFAAAVLCGAGAAAAAKTAPDQTAPDAKAAASSPVNDQAAQDRIMALVRAGKCGPAKTEATRVGDLSLADQIGTMCGARSSNPFPSKSGGSGRSGSGASGGGSRPGRTGGG